MGLSLAEGTGDPEDPAALIGPCTDGREHGGIADHASIADFLVPGIDEEIADLTQGAVAPGRQLVVQQGGGTADLA